MQTAGPIRSAVGNIEYYAKNIRDFAKQQFDLDFEESGILPIEKLDYLAEIGAATARVDLECQNIKLCLTRYATIKQLVVTQRESV